MYNYERLVGEVAMIIPTHEGRVMLELDNGRARLGQKSWVILHDMTHQSWTGYSRSTTELWGIELWGEVIITMTSDVVDDEWIAAHKGGTIVDPDPLVALAIALHECSEYA